MDVLLFLCLIDGLGNPSWTHREKAQAALVQALPHSAPYLKAAANHSDPEIAQRSKATYITWHEHQCQLKAKTTKPRFYGKLPWLDMLPKATPHRDKIVNGYLTLARETVNHSGGYPWLDYREATRLYILDLFRADKSEEEVTDLLDQMAVNEWHYVWKFQTCFCPKLPDPDFMPPAEPGPN